MSILDKCVKQQSDMIDYYQQRAATTRANYNHEIRCFLVIIGQTPSLLREELLQ